MRICIWCNKDESKVSFIKKAHTFPQSLGGDSICDNVCDLCNHYFGSPQSQSPAVEVVLKEILNISKYLLLNQVNEIPKNKRYKSEYFNLNWEKKTIILKPRYSLRKGYQEKLGRLFRRGLYKVFLEERERQRGDAKDSRFDFIREFARYNLSDYPIYYFKPKFGAVFFSSTDANKPMIRFTEHSDKLDKDLRAYDYLIMGHNFCFPTSRHFVDLYLDYYKKYLKEQDYPFGTEITPIKYVEDIDFTFKYLNDK
ncbi:MAG: HNH endonuclease [Bacteroidales bacterium]|jgi:hypothetical protein|nr:HNH endonuclease [Bacteroidales bacterium]MDY0199283.1 HNH endonuclease [Tenuifilaceae bacterium]